jgi:O-antigen ligase
MVMVVALLLASTQLSAVRDEFSRLLIVEGVEGNTRWDLWEGTLRSWRRAPVFGGGLGSYRHVIGIDKPATGTSRLEQAHNDWLEWLATSGIAGFGLLMVAAGGCVVLLLPGRVRRFRFEYRYPLAGAAVVLVAVGLHETVGFGLQTPLNRYLLAVWLGMMWGVGGSRRAARSEKTGS